MLSSINQPCLFFNFFLAIHSSVTDEGFSELDGTGTNSFKKTLSQQGTLQSYDEGIEENLNSQNAFRRQSNNNFPIARQSTTSTDLIDRRKQSIFSTNQADSRNQSALSGHFDGRRQLYVPDQAVYSDVLTANTDLGGRHDSLTPHPPPLSTDNMATKVDRRTSISFKSLAQSTGKVKGINLGVQKKKGHFTLKLIGSVILAFIRKERILRLGIAPLKFKDGKPTKFDWARFRSYVKTTKAFAEPETTTKVYAMRAPGAEKLSLSQLREKAVEAERKKNEPKPLSSKGGRLADMVGKLRTASKPQGEEPPKEEPPPEDNAEQRQYPFPPPTPFFDPRFGIDPRFMGGYGGYGFPPWQGSFSPYGGFSPGFDPRLGQWPEQQRRGPSPPHGERYKMPSNDYPQGGPRFHPDSGGGRFFGYNQSPDGRFGGHYRDFSPEGQMPGDRRQDMGLQDNQSPERYQKPEIAAQQKALAVFNKVFHGVTTAVEDEGIFFD